MYPMVWVHSINLRGSDSDSHTRRHSVSLKAANAVSVQETQDLSALPPVNESQKAPLIAWMAGDVHFINVLSKMLTDHFKPALRACLFIGESIVRTANNSIEKLAGSPVLSFPLMNNSAVRVNAGRRDLVADDWLSTQWPEGDTKTWALHPVPFITGCCVTVCLLRWPSHHHLNTEEDGKLWFIRPHKSYVAQDSLLLTHTGGGSAEDEVKLLTARCKKYFLKSRKLRMVWQQEIFKL